MKLNATEIEAIREFAKTPVGQHSAPLQQRLNVMRSEAIEGKYVLLCTKPHKEWVLAQMNGRTQPLTIHHHVVFHDVIDGEFEIFCRRWTKHFGSEIPNELRPHAQSIKTTEI